MKHPDLRTPEGNPISRRTLLAGGVYEFIIVDDDYQIITFVSHEPMSDFKLLLERQSIQLITLYTD